MNLQQGLCQTALANQSAGAMLSQAVGERDAAARRSAGKMGDLTPGCWDPRLLV